MVAARRKERTNAMKIVNQDTQKMQTRRNVQLQVQVSALHTVRPAAVKQVPDRVTNATADLD
jgi:hypothetical protein